MAKVKHSAIILNVQTFLDAIFIQGLKNAFWLLQIFRHSLIQMSSHFGSTYFIYYHKNMNIPDGNTLLLLWKLLAHNHTNVQNHNLKHLPLSITQVTVSKACHSVTVWRDFTPYLTGNIPLTYQISTFPGNLVHICWQISFT